MAVVFKEGYVITAVNDALCALFGYTVDELLGLNWLEDLGYYEDKEQALKWILSEEESYTIIKRYVKKDGNTFWGKAKVIRTEDDFFVILEDISAHKEIERLYDMLSRDFDTFTYSASHDLLEPIRTIKNYSDLLSLKYEGFKDDEEAQEAQKIISTNLDTVKKMVDALLSYSRIGTKKVEKKVLSLENVVEKCKYALKSLIDEKLAQIEIDCSSPILADELHMQRLFQNLIQNAIKYSDAPIIKIGCQGQMFWVSDNGVGIEKKYQEIIFKLFKKINPKGGGLGLGLTEVKRIVELYGGTIWLESELEKGTTFYFTLPKS